MHCEVCRRVINAAVILLLVFVFGGGQAAWTQSLTGQIEGTVIDASGASIPGVNVTATHVGTNTVYTASTNEIGKFVATNVRLGDYRIEAQTDGFKTAVLDGVNVSVGSTAVVNIQLEIGEVTTEVTVSASSAIAQINTVDAEVGGVIDEKRVLELPLNGRNAVELAFQQAGTYFERNADGTGNKLFVNGQRHRSVNLSLDGIDTQDNLNRASSVAVDQPLLMMAAENVQEFKVVTGNSSAEYSRGGIQISAVTRAGSNEFHGSLFNFHRNTVLNANQFFNNSAGVERNPLVRNQFGGRIGGPIVKDKTFFFFGFQQTREARSIAVNRTVYTQEARSGVFRFLDGQRNSAQGVAENPGAVRNVNILGCGGDAAAVLDRACVDERFDAGNPASLDPFISGTVFDAIPLPNNFDVGDGLNTGGFRWNAPSKTVENLPSARIDHRITDKHLFYASANYVDRNIQGDFINNREPIYPSLGPLGDRITHSKGFSASLVSTPMPTLVNEFRFGFLGGENAFIRNQPFGTPFTLDLNTITDPYNPGGGDTVRDNEVIHIRDTVSLIKGKHRLKFGAEYRRRTVDVYAFTGVAPEFEFDDNDFSPDWSNSDLENLAGGADLNSNDAETARDLMNNLVGATETIRQRFNATSITSGFVPGAPERHVFRNWEFDWFVNDSWQLRPNLTLNMGVRYEWAAVPIDRNGLLLEPENGFDSAFGISGAQGFFNPGVLAGEPCPLLSSGAEGTRANAISLLQTCATRYTPATPLNGAGPLWNPDKNNFAPVISVAWDPFGDGKTSIRAGFRVSYIQDAFSLVDGNLDDNEGLTVAQACIPSTEGDCQNVPGSAFFRDISGGNPGPVTPEFSLPSSRSLLNSSTIDFRGVQPDLGTSYYNEWNFGVSRELPKGFALEIRYLGNRGVNLRRVADFNEINVNAFDEDSGMTFLDSFRIAQSNLTCNVNNGSSSSGFSDATSHGCITPNPLMRALISGDAARLDSRTAMLDALRFNEPGQFVHRLTQLETSRVNGSGGRIRGGSFWGNVLDGRFPANFFVANPFVASSRGIVNDGFSTYHSMQIDLRRRFADGLTVSGNYTFGKALSDFDGDQNTLINDTRPSSIRNKYYTTQQFMPRHTMKFNWLYELPIGSGKRFHPTNKALKAVIGGWQFGGLANFRTGRPLSIRSGRGAFHRTAISDENTVNLSQNLAASDIQDLTGRVDINNGVFWFDPCLSAINGADCSSSGAIAGLFEQPEAGQLGTLTPTPAYGPSRFMLDVSMSKRTQITETTNIEFRWEAFNLFNNVNFGQPANDIDSSNFGRITATITNPRLMQFALKLNF